MTFTDDDLKQLKRTTEEIEKLGIFNIALITKEGSQSFNMSALLARLEAATDLTIYADHLSHCGSRDKDYCTCGLPERLDAWRKSAGKSV